MAEPVVLVYPETDGGETCSNTLIIFVILQQELHILELQIL